MTQDLSIDNFILAILSLPAILELQYAKIPLLNFQVISAFPTPLAQ